MTFTAATYKEACDIAAELRAMHKGTDWRVTIHRPWFKGDLYRVTVG